jgi:transcriptional regulator with XRE-family HTH domain
MLQQALDKTLKYQGIAGKQIADRTGISPSYVSEIRSGKRNPSLEMFERLLNAAEEIAPGSREYFAMCLAGGVLKVSPNIDYLAANLDDEELANLVLARGKYLKGLTQKKAVDYLENPSLAREPA